jgi:hypothetical protein
MAKSPVLSAFHRLDGLVGTTFAARRHRHRGASARFVLRTAPSSQRLLRNELEVPHPLPGSPAQLGIGCRRCRDDLQPELTRPAP